MKTKYLYITLLIFLFFQSVYAQWIQTNGPYGTINISALFHHDEQLYAATSCGIHMPDVASGKWKLKSSLSVETYTKKGDYLYFSGPNLGIQRIKLSEQTFSPETYGLGGATVISIKDGGTCFYAGILNQGFAKSDGYSKTWNIENKGLPVERDTFPPEQGGGIFYIYHVNSIEVMNDTVLCGTHQGVYRTGTDNFLWRRANNGLPADHVQLLKVIGPLVFAAVGNNLYYSSNKGNSWSRLLEATALITSINSSGNTLLVTTMGSGIYRSDDMGLTWMSLNQGLTDQEVTTLDLVGPGLVCGTANKGVYYYNGTTWVNQSQGIVCSVIMSMATTPSTLVVNDDQDVFTLGSAGSSWVNISPPVDKHYFGSVATEGETVFLSYKDPQNVSVIDYKKPGDTEWNYLWIPFSDRDDDAPRMNIDRQMLRVYEKGVMYYTNTSNIGLMWTEMSIPSTFCTGFTDFEVYKGTPLATACDNGQLLRFSNENGWQLANIGLPLDKKITSMAYTSDALYAAVENYGIYISKDMGQTWEVANDAIYTGWGIHSYAYRDHYLFITTAKGVSYSMDYGKSWISLNEGLPNTTVGPMVIYKDTLYVGTHGNGVWKHDLTNILPEKPDTIIPMEQVKIFPNPATDYVYFDFRETQNAQIRLIDMWGRILMTTKLGIDKRINIANLARTTYIIEITTDRYIYNSVLVKQ